jgi:hypothetical protein
MRKKEHKMAARSRFFLKAKYIWHMFKSVPINYFKQPVKWLFDINFMA